MLQYQSGDYCICIWDSEHTDLDKALGSLQSFTNADDGLTITVQPFDQGSDDDKAKKILEEASEVRGAYQYEGKESAQVLYEICDTITACINLAYSIGYAQDDIQEELNMVEKNNKERGRYE